MKSPEPDQLALRITIDAKGRSARSLSKAMRILILSVAASVLILSASYAPSSPLWPMLYRLYR